MEEDAFAKKYWAQNQSRPATDRGGRFLEKKRLYQDQTMLPAPWKDRGDTKRPICPERFEGTPNASFEHAYKPPTRGIKLNKKE